MKPGLPSPVKTVRPRHSMISAQAFSKLRSILEIRKVSASRSIPMTLLATLTPSTGMTHRPADAQKTLQKLFQVLQDHHVGTIARRVVWILMDLHKNPVAARRDTRPCERRHKTPVSAGTFPFAS